MSRPDRKEDIIQAAARLFSERGYHATTIRDIAKGSGVLSGSLYAHIETKEDLLWEIVVRAADRFIGGVAPVVHSDITAPEKLRQALRVHLRVAADGKDYARVFLHEWAAIGGGRASEILLLRDSYEALWHELINDGIREGTFRLMNRKFARLLVLSVANWSYQWLDPDGSLTPEEIADQFSELIFSGMKVTNPAAVLQPEDPLGLWARQNFAEPLEDVTRVARG